MGEVVYLGGNDNYRIVDCDLLGTGIIIHTGAHGVNQGGTASNGDSHTDLSIHLLTHAFTHSLTPLTHSPGYIARNTIWNANAAHWFSGIKQARDA